MLAWQKKAPVVLLGIHRHADLDGLVLSRTSEASMCGTTSVSPDVWGMNEALNLCVAFCISWRPSLALKADDGLGVLRYVAKDEKAPPVGDIEGTWFAVLRDGLLALCCDVPILGFVPLVYMFVRYSLGSTHLLFDSFRQGPAFWNQLCARAFFEATVWTVLFFRCISTVITYLRRYERLTRAEATGDSEAERVMKQILHEVEVGVLVGACVLGATLLWRVLSIHKLRVQAQAFRHKELAEERLEQNKADAKRAKSILDSLKRCYPEYFPSSPAPRSIPRVHLPNMEPRDRLIAVLSTFVLAGGLLVLQMRFEWVEAKPEWVPIYLGARREIRSLTGVKLAREAFVLVLIAIPTYQACLYWFKLIAGILRISHDFRAHGKQLMLFTFLTSESKEVEMWGTDSRKVLEEMREYMNQKASANAAAAAAQDAPGDKPDMQDILYGTLGEKNLDFSSRVDIMAWFHLRRWVQVDFLDDSASMECAGTVVVLLLTNLAFAGFMEWIQSDRQVAEAIQGPGTWLILSLCLVLLFLLYDVLEACVGINSLLERDSRLLLDAEIQQLNQAGQEGTSSPKAVHRLSIDCWPKESVPKRNDSCKLTVSLQKVFPHRSRPLRGVACRSVGQRPRRWRPFEGLLALMVVIHKAVHRLLIDCWPKESVPKFNDSCKLTVSLQKVFPHRSRPLRGVACRSAGQRPRRWRPFEGFLVLMPVIHDFGVDFAPDDVWPCRLRTLADLVLVMAPSCRALAVSLTPSASPSGPAGAQHVGGPAARC